MFEAEAKGLRFLKNTQTFHIPEVINVSKTENQSYLLMEYIAEEPKHNDFWETFGNQLAQLHQNTAPDFGLDHENYIGSLPQINGGNFTKAADFYLEKRLLPQLELAAEKGFSFQNLSGFYDIIRQEIPDEPPALIHGDLWNGNYLINENGHPCLIDPAVCFAPREMDLAMMKLFGGFPERVFESYHNSFPLQPGWKTRTDLWQLYYLLVHLNLFGSGYYNSVNTILKKYSWFILLFLLYITLVSTPLNHH